MIKDNPEKELFFFDESRFGTHSKIGHGWFKTGTRTPVKSKLGFKNFYLYTAVNPKTGENFTLEMPSVNVDCFNVYLEELSKIYPDKKIILVMDGAGWHKAKNLKRPENIEFIFLPPYSPELNPVERFWLYLKRIILVNRIHLNLDSIRKEISKLLNKISDFTVRYICNYGF